MKGKLIMTVAEMANRDNWLEARSKGIGGSEAAVIVGMSRFKSPFELWLEKTGAAEQENLSDNECVYWGTVLEQAVADRFSELTGKKVTKRGMLQDEEVPYFFANVDRVVVGENAGLECKTTNAFNRDEWEGDNIPDAYYCQCQWYMGVTGADKWYIACLIGGNKFVWKEVARNEQDIAALREAAKEFWQTNVQGGEMPPADGSKNCAAALTERFKGGVKEVLNLDGVDDANELAAKILDIKATVKELEKQQVEAENRLKAAMGDHEAAQAGRYILNWTTVKTAGRFDKKRFEEDYPGVYAQYLGAGGTTRRFTVKEAK
ncbi:MAG: endonuclease [Phascolarctobacterium sp.]|nr:MAG: endonuclease [Phascolarctobacterium sp.]